MKNKSTGAEFFNFEKTPKIVAILGDKVLSEQDKGKEGDQDFRPKGSLLGFAAIDKTTGEDVIIGSSHAIEKALENEPKGSIVYVEFLGQTKNAKGQKVNRFKVDVAESDEDEKELLARLSE